MVGGTPVSSTNKTDSHDVTEILLKVVLNTITLTPYILIVWLFLYCGIILTLNITNMNFNVEVRFVCFI